MSEDIQLLKTENKRLVDSIYVNSKESDDKRLFELDIKDKKIRQLEVTS